MRLLAAAAALITAFALAACGDEEGEDTTLDVTLREFSIEPSVSTVPKGAVTFDLENEGPDLEHELYILRTDFAPDELPAKDDGTVDLGAAGINESGHVNKFDTDRRSSGIFTLDAGAYVLICNLKDEVDGEDVAHYSAGMRVAFTVDELAAEE